MVADNRPAVLKYSVHQMSVMAVAPPAVPLVAPGVTAGSHQVVERGAHEATAGDTPTQRWPTTPPTDSGRVGTVEGLA